MKKLLIILLLIPLVSFGQSKKELKKIEKLVNNDRMDVFVDSEIKKIDVITLKTNDGRLARALKPHIQKTLLKEGVKVLSIKAAKQRLLEFKATDDGLDVNGASIVINSTLLLDITVDDWNGQMEVEIIDLAQEGTIIGYLNFKSGLFKAEIVGPAMIKKIIKTIENN